MDNALVDRAFIRLDAGLVHYRTAGNAGSKQSTPLYMAHSGPGSSLGLSPMIAELGKSRHVIAPDMMGNGDSDRPGVEKTDLRFYVDCVIETLDRLGIEQVDFYGQHTGALIGCELALLHPQRVQRLIFDGISLFPADLKTRLVEVYAPPVKPDDFGGHLAWAWNFCRDLFTHFPYYERDPAHRLHGSSVPSAAALQPLVVDLIKALPTYHLAYQAAFAHPTADRLTELDQLNAHRMLVMSIDSDPLAMYLDEAAALLPRAETQLIRREQRAGTIQAFLDA